MSDNGEQRPLTRRERRLLEMSQHEQPDVNEEVPSEPPVPASAPAANEPSVPVSEEDIVIDESAINIPTEDAEGNPLPRREMRRLRQEAIDELRQQKIAELAQEAERAQAEAPVAEPVTPPAPEQDAQPEDATPAAPTAPEPHEVPTQAFSVEDLQDALSNGIDEQAQAEAPADAEDATEISFEDFLAETQVPHTSETSILQEDQDDTSDAPVEDAEVLETPLVEDPVSEVPTDESAPAQETGDDEPADDLSTDEPDATEPDASDEDVNELPDTDTEGYTFPDIQPLSVDRPVFDDPQNRSVGTEDAPTGTGFDDMIERAVADENTNVHSGTSSLILPEVPSSEDLSGPLGGTGELFVTGSIELPKSIGETGGHSRLQESIEQPEEDALDMLGLTDMYESDEFDSQPVSATRAVSARSIDQSGVSTPEVKHDNKKSIIWMTSGGALIVVLAGLGFWAYQAGFFG